MIDKWRPEELPDLARGVCPDSGERLIRSADDGKLYCLGACDCFGINEADILEARANEAS